MIKNIVFDMGGVLRVWNPERFLEKLDIPREDRPILLKEIYGSVEWSLQDIGLLSEAETYARVCARIPARLHGVAEKLILHWEDYSDPMPGMAELIRKLKENGYGIWLLSNASLRHGQYWGRIPGSEYFDGLVISAYEKTLKPDRRMYETLLNRFALKAEECVFLDDMPVNVAGALAVGMDGFVFSGTEDCICQLKKRGVKL
ncbi:MAG: HAD family phosphatase [Oscillospiraceae bacterium]|nr:HAD family phosphatase [Oscillospiraceae bacterium]